MEKVSSRRRATSPGVRCRTVAPEPPARRLLRSSPLAPAARVATVSRRSSRGTSSYLGRSTARRQLCREGGGGKLNRPRHIVNRSGRRALHLKAKRHGAKSIQPPSQSDDPPRTHLPSKRDNTRPAHLELPANDRPKPAPGCGARPTWGERVQSPEGRGHARTPPSDDPWATRLAIGLSQCGRACGASPHCWGARRSLPSATPSRDMFLASGSCHHRQCLPNYTLPQNGCGGHSQGLSKHGPFRRRGLRLVDNILKIETGDLHRAAPPLASSGDRPQRFRSLPAEGLSHIRTVERRGSSFCESPRSTTHRHTP